MEITSPEAMAQLADDVRKQEEPFAREAIRLFEGLFRLEYRRLRATAIEAGTNTATLNVEVRCRFDPKARGIEMLSAPAPVTYESRTKAGKVA